MDIELFIYDCRCMVIDPCTFALTSGELNKLSRCYTYVVVGYTKNDEERSAKKCQ